MNLFTPVTRKPLCMKKELEFGILVFVEGRRSRNSEKTLGVRTTNNKLNLNMTMGPGFKPRPHWFEVSALTTAPPGCTLTIT